MPPSVVLHEQLLVQFVLTLYGCLLPANAVEEFT
jgi:hypothetical protein